MLGFFLPVMFHPMLRIAGRRQPFKIDRSVVFPIAVYVIDDVDLVGIWAKCERDKPMHKMFLALLSASLKRIQPYRKVAI